MRLAEDERRRDTVSVRVDRPKPHGGASVVVEASPDAGLSGSGTSFFLKKALACQEVRVK